MRVSLAALALSASLCVEAAELKLSGILGQSQEPGAQPIPCVAMKGAAFDKAGRLCSFQDEGRKLLRFVKDGSSWRLDKAFDAPSDLGPGGIQPDAGRLVFPGAEGNVFAFDSEKGSFAKLFPLPKETASFQLSPAPFGKGWRCLALASGAVWARGLEEAGQWSKLFDVERNPKGSKPEAIGIEPASGDVLVGSYWPDLCVNRYSLDGKQVLNASWPRTRTGTKALAVVDGLAWSLCQAAIPLPSSIAQLSSQRKPDSKWLGWSNGIAKAPDGRLWISCSQGVIGFEASGRPLASRIGGLAGPNLLAGAPDGTLIAHDKSRMIKLMIDDAPDAPLQCDPEEPFRTGANWRSLASSMQFDGSRFVVLDARQKRLWAFDPWHTGWKEDTWLPLTPENAFAKPEAVAAGRSLLFVNDGGEILFRRNPGEEAFAKTGVKAGGPIAANKNDVLFITNGSKLSAFAAEREGGTRELWSCEIGFSPSAISAGETVLAAIEPLSGTLRALSCVDGSPLAALSGLEVPGGLEPCSVFVAEPWIFVGDKAGKRILRFRLR